MWQSQVIGGGEREEEESRNLRESRGKRAFDFCFQLLYPLQEDSLYRDCIYQYSHRTSQAEKIFSSYLKERSSKKQQPQE